jgi:hypothetical protein
MADRKRAIPGEPGGEPEGQTGEAIIEFQAIGHAVKVSGIDLTTLTEVSIVAPASATKRQMTDAVLRKLRYVLARRKGA